MFTVGIKLRQWGSQKGANLGFFKFYSIEDEWVRRKDRISFTFLIWKVRSVHRNAIDQGKRLYVVKQRD